MQPIGLCHLAHGAPCKSKKLGRESMMAELIVTAFRAVVINAVTASLLSNFHSQGALQGGWHGSMHQMTSMCRITPWSDPVTCRHMQDWARASDCTCMLAPCWIQPKHLIGLWTGLMPLIQPVGLEDSAPLTQCVAWSQSGVGSRSRSWIYTAFCLLLPLLAFPFLLLWNIILPIALEIIHYLHNIVWSNNNI